jgi:hypothetical protein
MHVAARTRLVLARRPWIRWAFVALLASSTGLLVERHLAGVDAAREAWGASIRVHVADGPLEPDGPIATRIVDVPAAIAPSGAVDSIPDAAALHQRVGDGEILTDVDLAPASGPAARAAPGTAVVAIADAHADVAPIGAPVDVVGDGLVLAEDARIVEVGDGVVFVAVARVDAATVAAAAGQGIAAIVHLPRS